MNNPRPKNIEKTYIPISYPVVNKDYLDRNILEINQSFQNVIQNRKTNRHFSLISAQLLSSILWYSAKVIDIQQQDSGFIWSHTYVPSAGGRHPIDIILSFPGLLSNRKFCLYNSIDHSLNELHLSPTECEAFFQHISEIQVLDNATVLWFIADQHRTEAKYDNPLSLIWRDAGALLYSVQLVCCAFNLSCCPLGTLGEPFISNIFKIYTPNPVFGVGGCLIG